MPKLAFLVLGTVLSTLLVQSAGTQGVPSPPSRIFMSQIAPDLAVVTEVSIGDPYVGQQISILYKLRAQNPPTAVDIDPQQFPGFWAEAVPISQEAASTARPLKGQGAVDYLLRQIIAFPLMEGILQLPSLSLKVKRSGRVSVQRDDWDVVGKSTSIGVSVIPLPPGPTVDRELLFVGSLEGSMYWAEEEKPVLYLEIQGTANLALFRPLDWVRPPLGVQYHARLVAADNSARTIDRAGKRQLTLFQRQRWMISFSGGGPGERIDDLYLPVFEPTEKAWKSSRIKGIQVRNSTFPARDPRASIIRDTTDTEDGRSILRGTGMRAALILVAIAGVLTLILWVRHKSLPEDTKAEGILGRLEKHPRTSPRAFLESAQKCLEKCAQETGHRQNAGMGDTVLDRCWLLVQRYRFSTEPLPGETRAEILALIRQVLNQTESSPQDSLTPVPPGFRGEPS